MTPPSEDASRVGISDTSKGAMESASEWVSPQQHFSLDPSTLKSARKESLHRAMVLLVSHEATVYTPIQEHLRQSHDNASQISCWQRARHDCHGAYHSVLSTAHPPLTQQGQWTLIELKLVQILVNIQVAMLIGDSNAFDWAELLVWGSISIWAVSIMSNQVLHWVMKTMQDWVQWSSQ